MNSVSVDSSACVGCGQCVSRCPANLLSPGEGGVPVFAGGEACMACGHCAAVCPKNALAVAGFPLAGPRPEPALPRGALEDLYRARRSVRRFKDEALDRATLEALLEAARWAPTAKNNQDIAWSVLEDPAATRALSGRILETLRSIPAFAARYRGYAAGADPVLRGAPHLVVIHSGAPLPFKQADCVIAGTYLELAAAARGLGVCWFGGAAAYPAVTALVREAAGIPAEREIGAALMLGRPEGAFRSVPGRKALAVSWI